MKIQISAGKFVKFSNFGEISSFRQFSARNFKFRPKISENVPNFVALGNFSLEISNFDRKNHEIQRLPPKFTPKNYFFKIFLSSSESSLATARALIATCGQKMSPTTIDEIYRVTELIYSENVENPTELDASLTACSGALLGETIAQKSDWKTAQNCVLSGTILRIFTPKIGKKY